MAIYARLRVTTALALSEGRTCAGDHWVMLADEDVAGASVEERKRLQPFVDSAATRSSGFERWLEAVRAEASPACVVDSVRALLAAERAKVEADQADLEKRVAAVLAAPDEDWIGQRDDGEFARFHSETGAMQTDGSRVVRQPAVCALPRGLWLDEAERKDSRVVARRALVQTGQVLAERTVDWQRQCAEYERMVAAKEAADAAKDAEVERRAVACAQALRARARSTDTLARAERDGYPVEDPVLDAIAAELVARVRGRLEGVGVHSEVDHQLWRDHEKAVRQAPRADAFRLLDAVAAEAAGLEPAVGAWVVSPILRLDVCPHERREHKVTAVLATLQTPCGDREVTLSLESLECAHEPVESDDD